MTSTITKNLVRGVAGTALALGTLTAVGTPANADTAVVVSGSTASKALANCKAKQRTYISSWTKISVPCYYSGYAAGKYWYAFHYTSVGG